MLRAALIAAVAALGADTPRLVPGQRLEGVEQVTLDVSAAGSFTLARSNGALVLGEQRSANGWLTVELDAGSYAVELPDGPGDVTALAGAIEPASCATFLNSAMAQINAADFASARTSLLACRARPGSTTNHGLACMFEGSLLQRDGRLLEARELLVGSREAVAAVGTPDVVAFAEDSLGQVALGLRDWDTAQKCFERVRELATDAGTKAYATSRLAQVAEARGDATGARGLHEAALAGLDADAPATHVSSVSFAAGLFYQHRSEYARAAELLQRAADTAPRWDQKVAAVGQLGVVEMLRGRYGQALGLMNAVDALAAEHSPSPYDDVVLRNRSDLAFSLGEYGQAREGFERLLSRVGDDERNQILISLALVAHLQGDESIAMRLYDQALEALPEPGVPRWYALNGKAVLLLGTDRPRDAEPLAREALALAQQLDDARMQAASRITLSDAAGKLGALDVARSEAQAAVDSLQAHDARDLLLPAWHSLAEVALLQGDEPAVVGLLDRAWQESRRPDFSELSSLEESQLLSRVTELSDWGALAADLTARRVARTADTEADADARASVLADGLRLAEQWKARTLLADVQGHADFPADLLGSLRSTLDGRALIEYVAGAERLHAFVLQGDALQFVDLGARRPIEDLVQVFLEGISNEDRLASPADVARVGKQLYAQLLRPLHLATDRVVVVPCGDLSRLPFEALVVDAPDDVRRFDQVVFVLDRMDVGYAPSSATLVALAQRAPAPAASSVLLLGDPTYASEATPDLVAARGPAVTRWERLPHSRDELGRIARLLLAQRTDEGAKDDLLQLVRLEQTRDVSFSTSSFELRLGGEASFEALRSLAPHASLIHIAAHAQVDRWDPRRTGLVLAWSDAGQGLFSLADIAALKLDADLVVLSACRTADGRLLNGEGVQSMAGAFLAAGARGVVATLWPVFDTQAQDLMEDFESSWLVGGEAPDRALRLAKRALRSAAPVRGSLLEPALPGARQPGHPHYWASFLFTGATPARPR